MLLHVWPGLNFWFRHAIIWSPSWVISFLTMKFIKKTTGLVVVSLISTLAFSWSASIFVLSKFYHRWRRNQDTNRFFSGYESAGKTIGFALLFFGNVGLYYFSEKSIACMLTFLFLAFYCLCFLLCIQPCTDFGALEFLLSGSLNQTLRVFGLHSPYSWLVIIVCIVIAGIWYCLEPVHPPGQATSDEVDEGQLEEGRFTARSWEQSVPPTVTKAQDESSHLRRALQRSTASMPLEVTSDELTKSVPPEAIVSTVLPPRSTASMPLEVTSDELTKSVPPEAIVSTILPPGSTASMPLEVTYDELTKNVPPEAIMSTVLPPGSTASMPLEVTSDELTKNVPPEAIVSTVLPPGSTTSMPLEVTSDEITKSVPPEAIESTPLEETSKLTESVPPKKTSELTESVPLEATESTLLEETSELTESVPPEANEGTPLEETSELIESILPEAIESVPMEENSELTETDFLEATTLLLTSAAQGFRGLFAKSTKSAPSEVTSELTERLLPESTTMSSVSAQPPELTSKAREDAIQLHRAFEGWGCDAPTIVKVLAHRSATQRALIRREYKTKFSEDLDNRLSKELMLSSDLKRAVLLWMHDPATRDAVLVRQGLTEKLTLKLNVAIEVICSRTPSQIEQLKKAYRPLFGSYLEQDIESNALGDNKKLLLAYVGKSRSEGTEVDATIVDKDAKALFKDGEYKLGTNEETFIRIFSERSWAHLAAVNAACRSMYCNSLRKAVKKETSWNFKCALLTILECAENPAKYFAKVLHKAMDGLGTDEKTLSRIIVSRAEIDIQQIKAEYLKKYRKSLSDEVHSETSGNYRAFLLSLLDTNN